MYQLGQQVCECRLCLSIRIKKYCVIGSFLFECHLLPLSASLQCICMQPVKIFRVDIFVQQCCLHKLIGILDAFEFELKAINHNNGLSIYYTQDFDAV